MAPRYHKYRLKWPWTPSQLINLDEMLHEIYEDLGKTSTTASTTTVVAGGSSPVIVGDDGEDGEQGPPGPKGLPGVMGASGRPGTPGADGDDGYDGPPGPQGPTGATGATGPAPAAGPLPSEYVEEETPHSTTSATLEDIPNVTADITLTGEAHIAVWLNCGIDSDGICDMGIAVNINGTDLDEITFHLSGATDSSDATIIHRSLTVLAAGTHTVKGRFRRISGTPKIPTVIRADMLVMALSGGVGPQGPMGRGVPGLDGDDGLDGFPGPKGDVGPIGPRGPVGMGVPGEDGEDGEMGWPGPAGVSGSSSAANYYTQTTTLTDDQIKSLSTVPVVVVTAPGANKIAVPIIVTFWKSWAATYSAGKTFSCRYDGVGLDITSAVALTNSANVQGALAPIAARATTDGVNISNTDIVFRSSGNITGGNAANIIRVMVVYTILDIS